MPSCVARGCSSRYERGDPYGRLKLFPRKDLKRRQIWIERVNRSDWAPTKFSGLCDKHFDRSQWELLRQDGKQKLKSSALPTVFCVDPHTYQDTLSQEHAYCIQGYRQFYPENVFNKESESSESQAPVKVKVEVKEQDEDTQQDWEQDTNTQEEWEQKFNTPEEGGEEGEVRVKEMDTIKIKEEILSDMEEENSGSAEDIQCTPDIVLMKPYPIEEVECDQEEHNTDELEPSIDPLAISADDLEKCQKAPTFAHSRKFLFVTKNTRYVSQMQNVARAEPLITTDQPLVKILRKPPRLFKANELILYRNPAASPTKLPKLQIAPNAALLRRPQIPSSTIPLVNSIVLPNKKISPLKLKLISPPGSKTASPLSPVMMKSPTGLLSFPNSEVKPLLKLSDIQRIKVTSKPTNETNQSSTITTGPKKRLRLVDLQKPKFTSKPTYEPEPEFEQPKEVLLKGSPKGINNLIALNSSFKPLYSRQFKRASKTSGSVPNQAPVLPLKKCLFPGSSNAIDLQDGNEPYESDEEESVDDGEEAKLCSNISVNPSQTNVSPKVSPRQIIKVPPNMLANIAQLKDYASSGKSPVIILKPMGKSPPNEDKRLETSPEPRMKRRTKNKILYKCLLCKIIFLTYTTLRLHMFSKHKMTDMSLSRSWQVLGSRGEATKEHIKECINVKWIKDSNALDSKIKKVDVMQDGVRKCVLIQRQPKSSEDELNCSKTDSIIKLEDLSRNQEPPFAPYSLPERNLTEQHSEIGKRQRRSNESSEDVQEYKNDLLEIPNVNALKKSDDEFIRLTKLVTSLGQEVESDLLDTSGRFSDNSSTISARDSLCRLSDTSATLSAPETLTELDKLRTEESRKNNSRRPTSRYLRKRKELTARHNAAISKVTKNKKSESRNLRLRKRVEKIEHNSSTESNLKKNRSNLKKINTKNQEKAQTVERRSCRLKEQAKQEDGDKKATSKETGKDTQIKEVNSKTEMRNKRKPFNKTIVTKSNSRSSPSIFSKVSSSSKSTSNVKAQENLEFACSTCSERFARRSELRQHISTGHKVIKSFVCPQRDCGRRFESRREMFKHARIHKK